MSFESEEMSRERTGSCANSGQMKLTNVERETHLVAVERKEKLERIGVEDLDRRIEQRDSEELAVGAVLDGEYVVRHLERFRVRHREDLTLPSLRTLLLLQFPHLKVPELDVLVRASRHESSAIRTDVERPDGFGVRDEGLEERGGGQVVEEEFARLGAYDDLRAESSANCEGTRRTKQAYMAISGKEGAANGVAALHRPNAFGRLDVPNLEASAARAREQGVV